MTKKIISVVVAIVLVLMMSTAVFAEEKERFVFDNAGILTYSETEELNAKAKENFEKYGCETYIVTMEGLEGYEAWELNEMLYWELVSQYGAGEDVVILMLAMEERQYDLMAHGYCNTAFTDYGKDVMAERFLRHFGEDDWFGGFYNYLSTCNEFLASAAEGEPVDISYGTGASNFIGVIGAVVISCVIALLVCLVLRAQMKTARAATEAHDYAKTLVLKQQYDRFSHRDVRRVYNPPQENSGNGGGTTVNSGGFSHKSGGF